MLYLYTGREAVRPFTFTAAEFYTPTLLEKDLGHMVDVPVAIGAQYWVFSDDDLRFERHDAYTKGRARMQVMEGAFPLVFRSQRGACAYILSAVCGSRSSALALTRVSCRQQTRVVPRGGPVAILRRHLTKGSAFFSEKVRQR